MAHLGNYHLAIMKSYEAISLILKEMAALALPGVTTMEINNHAENMIFELGATSINKGYHSPTARSPWPTATCINVNNVICHGYPNEYKLQEGDIVSFDLGIKIDNQCADAALTMGVGEISNKRRHLLKYAKETLYVAIDHMKPGTKTEDLAQIIESTAISHGFLVNRRFGGHRIGEEMHMKPNIYNTTEPTHQYATLKVGEIYCVEPMLTAGRDNWGVPIDINEWCWATADGKDSAFFEHMVQITETGAEILTTHIDR